MNNEEANLFIEKIKERRKKKLRSYKERASKLDKYKNQIMTLRNNKASYFVIKEFLKSKKITVVESTIKRYIDKKEKILSEFLCDLEKT